MNSQRADYLARGKENDTFAFDILLNKKPNDYEKTAYSLRRTIARSHIR